MQPKAAITMIKEICQSGSFPVRSLSINILEKTGLIIPIRELIMFIAITKAIATEHPTSLFFANSNVDLGFPPGSNISDGEKRTHSPVNFSSNSSKGSVTVPLAGSFKYTFPFLNPSTTTK